MIAINAKKIILGIFLASLFTVSAFAANTGFSTRSGDGGSGLERSASSTDVDREGDSVNGSSIDLGGVESVSIVSGTVLLQDDSETSELRGSSLQSRSVTDYGYFIEVDSSLGTRLFVPSDYIDDSLCLDANGYLMGTRNSTFTCFIGQYSVRFPAYSRPQYRLTNSSGYTWTDTDIEYIDSPNVSVLGARFNFWDDRVKTLSLILIGGLLVCLCLKR